MRENFGAISFSQALIPNELKIICKVYGDIYTPGGYRGGRGYLSVRTGDIPDILNRSHP